MAPLDPHRVLTSVLDGLLERSPAEATVSGDHRFDDRLEDASPAALEQERRALAADLARLGALDRSALSREDAVDAATLEHACDARLFTLEQLRPSRTDPLSANPGNALYPLLARDVAPLSERLRSAGLRLRHVPESLAAARASLGPSPRVHLETAVGQFAGTRAMLSDELAAALEREPGLKAEVGPHLAAAVEAVDEHLDWLRMRLAATDGTADADPRLGPERFARKLALSLDLAGPEAQPDHVLAQAEANLERVEAEFADVARELGESADRDGVRRLLDQAARDGRVDDTTIVARCRAALETTADFVREHDLVTVLDDTVEVIVMPEVYRGVAVAYCDAPGPLETSPLPTYFAVAPAPTDWPAARVQSFYREYNAHMLHDITVHEAYPGHVLQLAHSRRFVGSTPVRSVLWNGAFVEGWAVYAEQLMVARGYPGEGGAAGAAALRLQQLKLQLRMTINAILDIRVHTRGMTESEAMDLMVRRGHQEEGEAHGKWRRALLTSGQLSTYFVGYTAVSQLVSELRTRMPQWNDREVHDTLLAHGSPAPRHLRHLLLEGDGGGATPSHEAVAPLR